MDQSPPKRVTRARAAAKTTDTGIKTTKIATAASKAKVTRTASTKRKTRSDDTHEDEEQQEQQEPKNIIEPEPRTTRGRPKKIQTEPEPEPEMNQPPKQRGRPKRAAVEAPPPEPARTTRGRAKKVDVEEDAIVVEELPKRLVRARATTVTKPALKKTVKFEEPDKENIVPVINDTGKGKAEAATGLRAKPVRKPASTRTTRGRAKSVVEEEKKSSPLSPKKATQITTAREATSEDELSTNVKTPMKSLMKSPMKPPGSVFGTAKKLDFSGGNPVIVNRASTSITQDLKGSVMASPARRPPQSPFRESMKASPQKIALGNSFLQSPFKPSLPAPKSAAQNSPLKASMLQSPVRRPQSPMRVTEAGSPSRSTNNASLFAGTPKASTFKMTKFATPRTLTKSVSRPGQMLPPKLPTNFATGSPRSEETVDVMMTSEPEMSATLSAEPLIFSGRLSSIMPRDADPALNPSKPIKEKSEAQGQAESHPIEEPMAVDEAESDTIVVENTAQEESNTPPASPSRHSTGIAPAFALRENNDSPFDDSDSEDELASGASMYSPVPLTGFKISSHDFASSPATPTPPTFMKTPKTAALLRSERREKIGFTPLARQLSDWMASSPDKSESNASDSQPQSPTNATFGQAFNDSVQPSPLKSTFFEDEMTVRDELEAAPESEEADLMANFEPVTLDEEDLALAYEADEMSLLEPDQIESHATENMFTPEETFEPHAVEAVELEETIPEAEQAVGAIAFEEGLPEVDQVADAFTSIESIEVIQYLDIEETPQVESEVQDAINHEIAPSEASQEYGDENAIPIDPELLALTPRPAPRVFSTPKKILGERVCHTVFKVPLKPAADHTPMRPSPLKRSASISKLPVQRPTTSLTRKNTVISYSPMESTPRAKENDESEVQSSFATPSKEAPAWSTMGTPARTPRRDLNTALLKGAIVFVDVHTSEGADASALFTELLTQMGARCVKTWSWNGNSEEGSKIGITHVVFKDGGKRTLEKVKETNGVVSCVGVGWVLDCERENKWQDESNYSIDTDFVPRGGHRRRKSMEPRALAKMSGTLSSSSSTTPARNNMSPSKDFMYTETPGTSKSRRRESVQWMRSPSGSSSDSYDPNDQTLILSPVPATPAPETISAYGEDGLYGQDTPGGQTPYFLHKEQLVQKTAPVRRYVDTEQDELTGSSTIGAGFLSEKKDESVMMRLMAARRKSLQFAPKVGSPLARGELF